MNFTGGTASGIGRLLDSLHLLVNTETIYGEPVSYINPWIALFAAVITAAAAALALGLPVLKLKGHYLAMATMGFGIIINRVVLGTKAFGEADGITNVPAFRLLPFFSVSGDFRMRAGNYYFAWLIVIIAMLLMVNLINSGQAGLSGRFTAAKRLPMRWELTRHGASWRLCHGRRLRCCCRLFHDALQRRHRPVRGGASLNPSATSR